MHQELLITIRRIAVERWMDLHQLQCLRGAEMIAYIDDKAKQIAISLERELQQEKMGETAREVIHRFKIPASWWQHFKQDCFPIWLKQLFPIRYREEVQSTRFIVDHFQVYPRSTMLVPPGTKVHRMMQWREVE